MGLVLAGIATALVVLARVSPVSALVAVGAVGALHANGVVSVPTPGALDRAGSRVGALQEQAVRAHVCRVGMLRATGTEHGRLPAGCPAGR